MTAHEFRTLHGDPQTWTTADIETQQNLAAIDQLHDPAFGVQHCIVAGVTGSGKGRNLQVIAPATTAA